MPTETEDDDVDPEDLGDGPGLRAPGGGEELRRGRDAGRKGEREAAPIEVVGGRSDDEDDARDGESDDGEEVPA